MSRMISPEMPAIVANHSIASRLWRSKAKATRPITPFQKVNSNASELQRKFERLSIIRP